MSNSEIKKEINIPEKNKEIVTKNTEDISKEEVIKSYNIGEISLERLEKGMEVYKGMRLAKIRTIGIDTDIKSTVSGKLKEILISDQSNVDYGKPLFVIEIN